MSDVACKGQLNIVADFDFVGVLTLPAAIVRLDVSVLLRVPKCVSN